MESTNSKTEYKRSPVAEIYETVEEHPDPIDADVTGIKKLSRFTFQCFCRPYQSQNFELSCSYTWDVLSLDSI